jgi:hypothetical protein
MWARGRFWCALSIAVCSCAAAATCRADDPPELLFDQAVAALEQGATDDAIDRFELLADRGFSSPDASYDRAMAYVRRAQSHSARAGDWGRAAAGLEEVLLARPADTEARVALERVHQEIARRRARARAADLELKPSLGWAFVGLLDERTWALLAAFGSLVVTIGLAARFARGPMVRLAGVVASSLGAVILVVTGSLAALSRERRLHARPAVVIVEEARLLERGDSGVAVSGPGTRIPEGALVNVEDQRGTLVEVEWGTLEGWLSLGQLRVLSRP